MTIIIKAPTYANSKAQIEQKYKLLLDGLRHHVTDQVELVESYFPLLKLVRRHEFIFVRDSVSLMPLYVFIFIFYRQCIIEINGDPIQDSNLPKLIKVALSRIKKYLLTRENIFLIFYSYDEAHKLGAVNFTVLNNFTNIRHRSNKIPRPKTFLMLIGSDFPWHGIDRVAQLAELLPCCQFYVFGVDKGNDLKHRNLFFHPPDDIENILNYKEFGYAIGSLRYQDGKSGCILSNSSLKGVLYQSVNLPFVQNFIEHNVVPGFQLLVTNEDFENPCLLKNKILNFMDEWEYVKIDDKDLNHLTVESYVTRVLDWFSNVRR